MITMVYSPHKYWSPVDEEYLDWLLPFRDTLTVPLFSLVKLVKIPIYGTEMLLKLYEDNKIGWAWWPFKENWMQFNLHYLLTIMKSIRNIVDYWNTE